MAGLPSGDRAARSANGAIEGQEGRIASDPGPSADDPGRAARGHTLVNHERAAQERVRAAAHGRDAAQQREEAARRRGSLRGREGLTRRVPIAEIDSLTGARTHAAGLTRLDAELDRCRQTGAPLVVVRVVVVGLQRLRDSDGDEPADELLVRIARTTRDHLRCDDLICRHPGDEFLCAMSNVTVFEARERFVTVASALADAPGAGEISTGVAELTSDETAAELIAAARCTESRPSPQGPDQAHLVLLPDGRGEGRFAANPGPPSPPWPGEAAGQN